MLVGIENASPFRALVRTAFGVGALCERVGRSYASAAAHSSSALGETSLHECRGAEGFWRGLGWEAQGGCCGPVVGRHHAPLVYYSGESVLLTAPFRGFPHTTVSADGCGEDGTEVPCLGQARSLVLGAARYQVLQAIYSRDLTWRQPDWARIALCWEV